MAELQATLAFSEPALEAAFMRFHANRNQKLETQFHYGRSLTWFAVLLRALASRDCGWGAASVIALGVLTTFAPSFAPRLLRERYVSWRVPIEVADNVLQVALGCFTHHHIYPSPRSGDPTVFQMWIVMLTGNGVAWLLFCSLWGSLPFRVALPQQAVLTGTLLLYNRRLCATNANIQHAYSAAARRLAAAARALAPSPLLRALRALRAPLAAGRACAPAVLAAARPDAEAVRSACMAAAANATGAAAAGAAATAELGTAAATGAELCLRWQPLSLLVLGFLLPTLYLYASELRLRCAFAAQHRAPPAGGPGAPRPHRLAHLPGLGEYAMFAVPAVAAMYTYIVVGD